MYTYISFLYTYIYIYEYEYVYSYIFFIEYGHEAKPSILGLEIVFLAARRDNGDGGGGDYRVRQEF